VRKNSACVTVLSLNLVKKTNPVIWSKSELPYDAFLAIPVPLPIGGVLILAANSIIYLNQTSTIALTLNYFGDTQGVPYKTGLRF